MQAGQRQHEGPTEGLHPGMIVTGPLLPEPVEILAVNHLGGSLQVIGRGLKSNQVHTPVLRPEQLAQLTISPIRQPFDGDPVLFRLGVEAHRLGLAYEYDPFFSLSIARIDPLPHQLEAVYEYFLKLPRIRFLLADDPGAGKTIMAGLLIKELKARSLAQRILIVTPANLGPALEIFSRYSRVEKASGEAITLKEYLEHVWAAVAREALSVIFADADASGLEPDARLTAMWLWTLTAGAGTPAPNDLDEEASTTDEEEAPKSSKGGAFSLEYDAARKIAQGLGANLEVLRHVVEVKGDTARLLPVVERAPYLLGKDAGQAPKARRDKARPKQLSMFEVLAAADEQTPWGGELSVPPPGATVLDRLHQAMILFAGGRAEALRRFLVEEGAGNEPRLWKLAQSLSALYPAGTDEKRWVDGVLARKKGLGF